MKKAAQSAREVLNAVYAAFNARDIDGVFAFLRPDVHWPNGMDGGWEDGLDAVRAYWTRQWSMIDPHVDPLGFSSEADGRVAVRVHQVVRDLAGKVLGDEMLAHVYRFGDDGLIAEMEIRKGDA